MTIDLESLYHAYGPLIQRRCLKILKREDAAYDALQDVFLSLLSHPQHFLQAQSPVSYLFAMSTNRCLNILKRNKKVVYSQDILDLHSTKSTEDEILTKLFVEKLFQSGNDRQRMIYYLRFVENHTLDEVAEIMELSLSGVRKILRNFQEKARTFKETGL